MRRLAVLALAATVAAVVVASAHGALFFLFVPRSADAGQLVTIRLGGTPTGFTLADRERPFGRPMRIYLVPNGVANEVTSRLDPRLHFVGLLVPDRDGRGVLSFRAPPLDTASYAVAAWCPACAGASFGETFFVLGVTRFTRSRFPGMLLRLRLPDPRDTCPVTTGTYGNGLLSTGRPADGTYRRHREPDGTIFDKPGWLPRGGTAGQLRVSGERLDGRGELRVLAVRASTSSWRTAMTYSDEGCWRITGRYGDVALTYVVRVVATS